MSSNPQRSFAGGEIAPALHARADLARYAIGLRTCRNMFVMRAGGATKRPGTKFVNTVGVSAAYTLTLTPAVSVVASHTVGVVAVLRDWVGNPVTTFPCTFETDDATIATIAGTGPRSANVTGVANGVTTVRARIAGLGLVSNNCAVTVTDFWVLHAFANNDTFIVTNGGNARILLVGGGGSGGSVDGTGVGAGGGGAGGVVAVASVAIAPGSYPVQIGGGGIRMHADHTIGGGVFGSVPGANGASSLFLGYEAHGGGGGGGSDATLLRRGRAGGCGGGGASAGDTSPPAGAYNGGASTAVLPEVGNPGGTGLNDGGSVGAGGGGAGGGGTVGAGGAGFLSNITTPDGSNVEFARGGNAVTGPGASGGASSGNGGEGGGQALNSDGGAGGSGVLYVRYRASSGIVATGGVKITFP